jgi:hypothetical protein
MLSSICCSGSGRNEPVILLRKMNVLKPEMTDLTLPNEIGPLRWPQDSLSPEQRTEYLREEFRSGTALTASKVQFPSRALRDVWLVNLTLRISTIFHA